MASRGGSVVVWLLATFTILTVFMPQELHVAACSEETMTCEADAVCNECMLVGDAFNQEFEDCNAEVNFYCAANLQYSCCQHQVLETDCLANEAFVAYWWSCWMSSCDISYPNAEDCSEFLGVPVTSGDVTYTGGTPAPTVAADTLTTFSTTTDGTVPATEPPTAFVVTSSMMSDSTVPTTEPPTAADAAVPDPIAAGTPGPVAAPVPAPTATPEAAAPTVPAPTATPEAAAPTAPTAVEAGEVTTVTVTTNAFDARTDDDGCTPDGCTGEKTRDGDLTDNSRWSCSAGLVEAAGGAAGEECQVMFELGEAQLVTSVSVAFLKGDTRTRTLNINVNGELFEVVTSGGTTSGLEIFELDGGAGAPGVLSLGMESSGLTADEFLSIIEVEIAVGDSTVGSSAAASETPAPVALPTPAPVALPTPASVASETPAPMALPTPGPIIAPTESPVPAPAPTPLVVADDTPAPFTSAVTPPASTPDPTPAPTSSARDVGITLSPATELATVGSGPSSEDTTTVTSDIDALYSSTGDCTSCIYDDECSECLSTVGFTDENAAEYSECIQETFTTTVDITDADQCEYMLAVYCCLSSASENDCMAMDEYVELIQCALQVADCSFDEITCSGVIGAGAAGSGAGPAVPHAISYLRAVSTVALGFVAVLVAMV